MAIDSNVERVRAMLAGLGARHVLIGGHAMAAYGRPRRTFDVDFAVDLGSRDAVIARMERAGYETLHSSAGYSNHLHPDAAIGRVDFVYVAGATADRLFEESRRLALDDGTTLDVARPEHLAAMKVLAMKNDPSRTFSELADIAYLSRVPGVDRGSIAAEFDRHGMRGLWDEIERSG
jgi:predicted nucleotidyltransferase